MAWRETSPSRVGAATIELALDLAGLSVGATRTCTDSESAFDITGRGPSFDLAIVLLFVGAPVWAASLDAQPAIPIASANTAARGPTHFATTVFMSFLLNRT